MRGKPDYQSQVYYAIDIESWIESDHPLRGVKARADSVLKSMRKDFDRAYSTLGRPSIPPEMLLKALLLKALYSIRSERLLVDQVRMNLLYRWFLDLSLDAPIWSATSFTKNRERFEKYGLIRKFFDKVVAQALVEQWASDEHFTVDGTLIQSYASQKSLRPIATADTRVSEGSDDDDPGNPTVNFRGQRRTNQTHRSLTDPEARLARKAAGQQSRLAHGLHVLMENRNGLMIDLSTSEANGHAERQEAVRMIRRARKRQKLNPRTLGADTGYDDGHFFHELEHTDGIVPLIPTRRGKIRDRTEAGRARTRARRRSSTKRYQQAQRVRKRIEETIGWCKVIGGMERCRHIGRWKNEQRALVVGAAYNLLRLTRLSQREQCA